MNGLGDLIIIQFIFLLAIYLLLRNDRKHGRPRGFYWLILAVYLFILIWWIKDYVQRPRIGEGGYAFALGMYAMMVPGALLLIALFGYLVNLITHKKNKS